MSNSHFVDYYGAKEKRNIGTCVAHLMDGLDLAQTYYDDLRVPMLEFGQQDLNTQDVNLAVVEAF